MSRQTTVPSSVAIADEVRCALEEGRPVVALESAVITHGLPDPRNLEAAAAMSDAIRAAGAVPAICLIDRGSLQVGASLECAAAAAQDPAREKASVRDLGAAIVRGISAGLTVSATLVTARLAGIAVFATGGIGGVHLGVEESGDVSSDLLQLARSPMITVCAGAKSVLDIPRTLEFLETAGVPVYGYRTEEFPAFYLRSSGARVPALDSPETIARVASAQWELGSEAGMVIGNPIPEGDALDPAEWAAWLGRAREEATRERIGGKDVTPFLLERVAGYSEGRTVTANIALLRSNAALAAEIARALTT